MLGDEAALIAAAVEGKKLEEVATAAGVSVSTAQRRLRDLDIKQAIRDARLDKQRQLLGQLNGGADRVLNRLNGLVDHEDPRIALAAVREWLRTAGRLNLEAGDLEERLDEEPCCE